MVDYYGEGSLVSVVITTYNRSEMFKRALKSVELQTYENIEIVVVDDNSSELESAKVQEYLENTSFRFTYHRNDKNCGPCASRNIGFNLASGIFVAGLDDDDEFTRDRLSVLVSNYRDEYAFITGNTRVVSKRGVARLFKRERKVDVCDLMWFNCVGTQVLVLRERILSCGGFDVSLGSAQDADMWVRLVLKYGAAMRLNCDLYVLHTEHESSRVSTSNKKISGFLDFVEKHKCFMTSPQKKFKEMQWKWMKGRKIAAITLVFYPNVSLFLMKRILGLC